VSYLLDTNIVSELTRPEPESRLVMWLESVDEDQLRLSVATIAELRFGVARLPASRRKRALDHWLRDELLDRFSGRVLPVDTDIALAWGDIRSERQKAGRPISAMDAMLAATARVHRLALVTRNAFDFIGSLGDVINPWAFEA
jgi:toxin FitB